MACDLLRETPHGSEVHTIEYLLRSNAKTMEMREGVREIEGDQEDTTKSLGVRRGPQQVTRRSARRLARRGPQGDGKDIGGGVEYNLEYKEVKRVWSWHCVLTLSFSDWSKPTRGGWVLEQSELLGSGAAPTPTFDVEHRPFPLEQSDSNQIAIRSQSDRNQMAIRWQPPAPLP